MNRDFKDLLSEFCAKGVEFLVVGAHALAAHGHVRATKDLDVWVRPSEDNAPRVLAALRAFGAPLGEVSTADFSTPGLTFQIGVEPVRIDVGVLSLEDLLANKKATGRLQDLADVEALERLRR